MGNGQSNSAKQEAQGQTRNNQVNKGQQGQNQRNQDNQRNNNKGRGANNVGVNVPVGAVNPTGAPINQVAMPPAGTQETNAVVPFNSEQRANQEISNISTGIIGAGTPVNPDESNLARAIKNNSNRKIGNNRLAYFNNYAKNNKKAKNIKLVNLACIDEKWKQYRTDEWGYDVPVGPVNQALKSCVYTYSPEKPGKYDKYVGINPPILFNQAKQFENKLLGQMPAPLPAAGPAPAPGAEAIPIQIPVQESMPIQMTPIQTQTPIQTIMQENPLAGTQPVIVQISPEEAKMVTSESTAALVEKFMIGVDSNNQNMRYLMWITIILLIVIIIGFYYKSKKEKMIIRA